MEKLYDVGIAAATSGTTAFLLAKLLSGGTADQSRVGSISGATAVGISAAVGSATAQLAHDYVLPHIPQPEKYATVEAAALNAAAAGIGAYGSVYLLDADAARSDGMAYAAYAIGGEMLGNYLKDNFIAPVVHAKMRV